jgi:hypothetical protein
LEAIERPAAEGQAQGPGIGQGRGDDLGALLGGVGRGPAAAAPVIQAGEAVRVEAMDPGVDRRPRDADLAGDLAGRGPVGGGQEEPGPLDQADGGGAGMGEFLQGRALLGAELAERDLFGDQHGCKPPQVTPVLRQAPHDSSLAG